MLTIRCKSKLVKRRKNLNLAIKLRTDLVWKLAAIAVYKFCVFVLQRFRKRIFAIVNTVYRNIYKNNKKVSCIMSDSNLSSVMQHRGNFTSKANFPKKSEASGEPRKTTENCYDFGIRSFPDTNKLYLSRNCFAKKLKVLSPSVCHCGLCHKFYFCLKNVSASTKSTSKIHQGKSLSVTFQVFKLGKLRLACIIKVN